MNSVKQRSRRIDVPLPALIEHVEFQRAGNGMTTFLRSLSPRHPLRRERTIYTGGASMNAGPGRWTVINHYGDEFVKVAGAG